MDTADDFDPIRPQLVSIAYRMLGSRVEADDVIQDAFVRWMEADRTEIRSPQAWLRRTVTRLCLDQLKSARKTREIYVGPWLPEPIVQAEGDEIDDVTLPLLLVLERLSPLERAAFLLHDVFELDFDEVGEAIGRDAAAVRQLASRARAHVRANRPRYPVESREGLQIAEAFLAASRVGDVTALCALLADGVRLHADGGGKRPAGPRIIEGIGPVTKVLASVARRFADAPDRLVGYGYINGLPGYVTIEADGLPQTTALEVEDGKIIGVYVMRNPDKLGGVVEALH